MAAVDCNNRLAPFSQKHAQVDISAPGVDILSTASRQLANKAGMVKAAFRVDSSGPKLMTTAGIGGTHSQIRWSGIGKVSGSVADCGDGSKPCPGAKGNICLVQWDPKMKGGAENKANSGGGGGGGANMRGRLLRWINSVTGTQQNPTGVPMPAAMAAGPPGSQQQPMPTKFTCDLMEYCIQQVGRVFEAYGQGGFEACEPVCWWWLIIIACPPGQGYVAANLPRCKTNRRPVTPAAVGVFGNAS